MAERRGGRVERGVYFTVSGRLLMNGRRASVFEFEFAFEDAERPRGVVFGSG